MVAVMEHLGAVSPGTAIIDAVNTTRRGEAWIEADITK